MYHTIFKLIIIFGFLLFVKRFNWNVYLNRQREVCDWATDPDMEPTCGRPLGLKFSPTTCDLYIADAYFGLMVVGPNGGQAQQLVASADGVPFGFTNALDIDSKTGVVYFTDSSIRYQRRYPSVYFFYFYYE